VKLNGLLAERRGDALHQQMPLRDGLVAGVAHPAVVVVGIGCPRWVPKIWSELTRRVTDHRGARLRRMLHAPRTTARSTPSVPGSTPGPASATSPSGCTTKALISS